MRIGQLREITGNRIPTHRNQNTTKSSFGKPFCHWQNEKHPKQPLFQSLFLPVILPPEIKAK